jgi:NADP-dependent 3-hydroxy acid dehydrogenase YdfG
VEPVFPRDKRGTRLRGAHARTKKRVEYIDLDLTGKLALVSGSTRGIGLASAAGLAQMGAEVIVNGRDNASIAEAIAKIGQASPSAALRADGGIVTNRF